MKKIMLMICVLVLCAITTIAQAQSGKSAYENVKPKAKEVSGNNPKDVALEKLKLQLDEANNSIEEIDKKLDALQAERNALQARRQQTKEEIAILVFGLTPKSSIANKETTPSQTAAPPTTLINSTPATSSVHTPGTDVHVKGYYRKDGTYVRPHTRSAPKRKP
jgi:peptidoglycan hydrolase CwlO-like protein